MSAERDNQQGMTFIFSNFYQLYRQGKIDADSKHEPVAKGKVLKAHSVTETPVPAEVRVMDSHQTQEWSKWANHKNVREHLRSLREAKQRLKFLTQELDEMLKRSGQ